MAHQVNRRDFLKAASAASGALAAISPTRANPSTAAARPKIADVAFVPADYPIAPTRYSDVVLEDAFWKPKIDATRRSRSRSNSRSWPATARGLSGNVLEAAILLAADASRCQRCRRRSTRALRRSRDAVRTPRDGNGGFEVAVT